MAPARALNMESCFGRTYRSAAVLELTSLKSTQNRGLPFWTTTTTGEAISEEDSSMMSSSLSLSTASLINFHFRGDVR